MEDRGVLFKAKKSRKQQHTRRRDASDNESHDAAPAGAARSSETVVSPKVDADLQNAAIDQSVSATTFRPDGNDPAQEDAITKAMRQRRLLQKRRGGVEFASHGHAFKSTDDAAKAPLSDRDTFEQIKEAAAARFAPQRGQVKEEMDKHMMEFIESELARRSKKSASKQDDVMSLESDEDEDANLRYEAMLMLKEQVGARPRQPATAGKLHEIDLGPGAKERNEARTQAAITGDTSGLAEEKQRKSRPMKPRIGRDGKMYTPKPRPRPRRNSADIARDLLVDQLMRETHTQVYDDLSTSGHAAGQDPSNAFSEGTSDDRIAEQFRRDFMDAVSLRRERARKSQAQIAAANKRPGGGSGPVDDRPRGPKLGGSRSARAAMREREAKAAASATGAKR